MIRRTLLTAMLLGIAVNAAAQDDLKSAMEARSAGQYARAIELLRSAQASHPDARTELLLAETLAWDKQFDESAELYDRVRRAHPQWRQAELGLGRVRLWQGRYGDAEQLFSSLLGRDESDTEAREGLATAAYWSGDYRTAERHFRRLRSDLARRSLAEIRAGSRPRVQLDLDDTHDDQPFHSMRTALRGSTFTDPLTRWDASLGGYRLSRTPGGAHQLPFATIGNETVFPSARLTLTASIGGIRTPDDRTHSIGAAAARFVLWPHSTLSLTFARREIVTNATHLYPFVRTTSLRWQLDGARLASLGAERLHYSDRNSGVAADGYLLLPLLTHGRVTIRAGASALYRDTRDPRFYVTGISSVLDNASAGFRYTYRGAYDPYWTPDNLLEARAIVGLETRIASSTVVRLQGDAGHGRDDALGFWPGSGSTPFPSSVGTARFRRSFDPRRVRLSVDTPLPGDLFFNFGFEHGVTAFYEDNAFHATVGRRR